MSPEAITSFKQRAARARNTAHGTSVTFRGTSIRAVLAPLSIGLDLAEGGLRQGGEFVCRFLTSDLTSAPRRGESMQVGQRTYSVLRNKDEIANVGEYVCVIAPGGTL